MADPPGPAELRAMVDEVLRGIATREYADVLLRAAAFARVVATGRAVLAEPTEVEVRRMLLLAEQLGCRRRPRARRPPGLSPVRRRLRR